MVSEVSMHTPLLLESVSSGSCTRWSILSPLRDVYKRQDQKKRLGTKRGFIAVKSNCSIQSYVPALSPFRDCLLYTSRCV